MHRHRSSTRRLGPLALALCALAACGDDAPAPTTPPVISAGPPSYAVAAGRSVTFTVGVSGGGTLAYQWRRDGAVIAGATQPTYTLPAAALADDGARFSVKVSNGLGAVVSPEGQLTVFPAPAAAASCAGGAPFTAHGLASGAGQAAGAALAGCSGALREVTWTQTAGPAVSPVALRSQAFGFDPPQAGTYGFSAAFTDAQGAAQSAEVSLTVGDAPAAGLVTLRTAQAVREGGGASLRAWPALASGDAVQAITWAQLEGPAADLEVSDPLRAIFTAPAVAQDALLRFRVTVRTLLGATLTDDALVLVEHAAQAPDDGAHVFGGMHVGRVHPYHAAGPWAGALAACAYDPALQYTGAGENLCALSQLPFLGQETGGQPPTVDQVMDHVLVSHDWMGDVLQQLLEQEDPDGDLRRLFEGVTAIVIGAHVRPSFYFGLTGAIYLDADDLWLTPEQRDVVDEVPDYRSGFDSALSYGYAWRYARDGQYLLRSFPIAQRGSRTLDYLRGGAGWVLFHELGHAGDFMPPSRRAGLDPAQSAWASIYAAYSSPEGLVSDQLETAYPLHSDLMQRLAQVKYGGATPTAAQRALGPLDVAAAFAPDLASAEYAYVSPREDLALLFEAFMMQHRLGAQYDIAFTDPITPTTTGSTLLVRWGERGRIGADSLKPRVLLVTQQVGPWVLEAEPGAVDALPAPISMRAGESWTANLVLPAPPAGAAPLATGAAEEPVWTGRHLRHGPPLPLPRGGRQERVSGR